MGTYQFIKNVSAEALRGLKRSGEHEGPDCDRNFSFADLVTNENEIVVTFVKTLYYSMQCYRLIYKGWMGLMLANMASVSVVKDYDKVFIPDEMLDEGL